VVLVALLQNSVLGYAGVINSLFTVNGSAGTRFRYKDTSGSVAGVTRAFVGSNDGISYRLRWRAEAVGLVSLDASLLDLDLSIGDDAFAAALTCTATSKITRCKF